MRELNFFETNHTAAGISNLGLVSALGLSGGVAGALTAYGYFHTTALGTTLAGVAGLTVGSQIGLAIVCTAALIKFAGQDVAVS